MKFSLSKKGEEKLTPSQNDDWLLVCLNLIQLIAKGSCFKIEKSQYARPLIKVRERVWLTSKTDHAQNYSTYPKAR